MLEPFITENLFRNANAMTPVSVVVGGYRAWACRCGQPQLTRTEIIESLKHLGYSVAIHRDVYCVLGLSTTDQPRYTVVDDRIVRNPAYQSLVR